MTPQTLDPVPRTRNGRHLLVVDDAPTVRLYHGAILRQGGFEIAEAGNGFEALELALGSLFDLMIVDVNMPQMDGHTLVRRLRDDEVGISCPIVMITTEARESDADTAYRAGANLFLTKPVAPELLLRMARILTSDLPAGWARSPDALPSTGPSLVGGRS